jgi:hypothetical protein
MLLALTFLITTTAPPLPPEEAARVLRGSRSIADRTDARPVVAPDVPRAVTIRSLPGDGPYGPLPRYAFPPLNCCSTYVIHLPRDSRYRRGARVPISGVAR